MGWAPDDAVLLTAIAIGGAGSLDRLLANIDVCNHDVPPFEVVAPALGRLAGAGLIEKKGNGFRLSKSGRKVVRGTRAATIERVSKVRGHLATVPLGADVTVLERDDWNRTVEQYADRHGH